MKFSIVIPVAPERGAEVLSSIEELNYQKKEYHVIVVKGLNPSENRNNGYKKSKGEIIVFLDDDCIVDKDLLKNADDFFAKHQEIDIVGGAQLTPDGQQGFGKISGYALSSKFGAWKMFKRYSKQEIDLNADETMLTSAILFCRKKVMEKIQFDPRLFPGEDPKFIEDAKKAGFSVAYSPDLIIYHKRRDSFKGLIKQIASYGRTRTLKESFFSTLKMPFFLIPSIFVLYLVFIALVLMYNLTITGNIIGTEKILTQNISFLILLPFFLYVIADIFFSFHESVKNNDLLAFFSLIYIFPAIHLSYGLAMLFGYVKKQNRKK